MLTSITVILAQKMSPLTNDDVERLKQLNQDILKSKYENG